MAITDNESTWEISYDAIEKDAKSIIYDIVYQNEEKTVEGNAVSSITEYEDGTYEYTLVISIDGYTLYFIDKVE